MSPGNELDEVNLRGGEESLKQNSWDTRRVWWAPILTRGKLHMEVFDAEFPGETEAGAALLVPKVRAAVNKRFQNGASQHKTIWVDRGKGFYQTATGKITVAYKKALAAHGFQAALGDDASIQPGRLQEMMLHETAVSWMRRRLASTLPAKPWEETRQEYASRLKACCDEINRDLDVEALCRAFPRRIQNLVKKQGGRLKV